MGTSQDSEEACQLFQSIVIDTSRARVLGVLRSRRKRCTAYTNAYAKAPLDTS